MGHLNLKEDLMRSGATQTELAKALDTSTGTVSLIVNWNRWPKGYGGKDALQLRIAAYLLKRGVKPETVATTFDEASAGGRANVPLQMVATATTSGPEPFQTKDPFMLLRHHTLSRDTRAHFRIVSDPFVDELQGEADVFITDDIRYVRASMRQTAKHGGMLAVVGESGGGKSTLRHDLNDWINSSGEAITVVEPYVIGMEDSRQKGAFLKAADITGAVIRAVSPGTSLRLALQDRAAQMHKLLQGSAQVGRKHVLIIEEAHALATPTIKHLKRFYELQDGFKKLLAIILIGQTELEWKLSENNPEVREVVQRCELVKLHPLDNHVEAYLRHKFSRVGLEYDKLFADEVPNAIRDHLRVTVQENSRSGQRKPRELSLCYPLAINNLVTRAMNEAVKIGSAKVTGALIAASARSPE